MIRQRIVDPSNPTADDYRDLIKLARAEGMTMAEVLDVVGLHLDRAGQYRALRSVVMERHDARVGEEDRAGGRVVTWVVGLFIAFIAAAGTGLIVWHQWSTGGAGW